jgi:hypothetical protein
LASWKHDFCTSLHFAIESTYWKFSDIRSSVFVLRSEIYIVRNFPRWLVQTSLLETSAFTFKCTVHSKVWFSVSISMFLSFKIVFPLIRVYPLMTKKKQTYWKTQNLKKRQFRTSVLCVCWCLFSAFWRDEKAIFANRSFSVGSTRHQLRMFGG